MKIDRVLSDDVYNICLDCNHLSLDYGEVDMEYEEEAVVVCPKCTSSYYYIANEEDMGKGAI